MKPINGKWISTNRAIKIVVESGIPCTRTSMISWIREYDLGRKYGGRWYVDKGKLEKYLKGEAQRK